MSLDATMRGFGEDEAAGAGAEGVRLIVLGSYAGSHDVLETFAASGRLRGLFAACTHVEAVIQIGKLDHIELYRPLDRCHTLAIVKASWSELGLIVRPLLRYGRCTWTRSVVARARQRTTCWRGRSGAGCGG